MMPMLADNLVLVGLALVALLLLIVWGVSVRRRTRITRGPAAAEETARRNQALIDAAPVAATADPAPMVAESDLARLKGVGPKLIAQLHELGVTSLAQIAAWDAAEIARIDSQLGRFAGRIERDDWVGQAQLLGSGDQAAYEDRFGKL